ncbi:hypothetical protein MMG85_13420 [Pseudoxanthomonas sp. LH2527]|uniref:hypothetical protein n=1 Tax=Pseudoxanthomonas sp. LH2527 TaxID=2923249 RepID=UPI001F1351C7|nr:hypothetical protein [Pseudoxanthomonas sp. LH2527]MCH6484553.1 hypothetical protein [Pseudoxanthomonas sp. LH2527]
MKRLQPGVPGLFVSAVFVTAEPRVLVHSNSPSHAGSFPRRMHVEAAGKRTVQGYGVARVLFGLGLAAVSLYTPRT